MSLDVRQVPEGRLQPFGTIGGQAVMEAVLRSPGGIEVRVLTLGAIVRDYSVVLPGGQRQSVVLGHDSLEDYLADENYIGTLVGRFANRIAGGSFSLDGVAHRLDRNEGGVTTLHGGSGGFSTRVWTLDHLTETEVVLVLVSPDGDQGFPGELTATCRYRVSDDQGLVVEVSATTTRATPVSLAQHSYFSLGAADVRDLILTVQADSYTLVDDLRIPTGQIAEVANTPFDFRAGGLVGSVPGGLDHNFVLRRTADDNAPAAILENRNAGLALEVQTTQPGLQVYDGSMIRSAARGNRFAAHAGICLETQAFPDSPNQPAFPSCVLRPGQTYSHTTRYRIYTTSGPA